VRFVVEFRGPFPTLPKTGRVGQPYSRVGFQPLKTELNFNFPKTLGDQEDFAGGFSGFEVTVGLLDFGQRVLVADMQLEGS